VLVLILVLVLTSAAAAFAAGTDAGEADADHADTGAEVALEAGTAGSKGPRMRGGVDDRRERTKSATPSARRHAVDARLDS